MNGVYGDGGRQMALNELATEYERTVHLRVRLLWDDRIEHGYRGSI